MNPVGQALALALLLVHLMMAGAARADPRVRVIVETDAGGDPDDEQSLVRFLLYTNEWDVEGLIANRPVARHPENQNRERTGLGIVRAQLRAYEECYPHLLAHDRRFPTPQQLWQRTVSGYQDSDDGVQLIVDAVDRADPRPVWFMNWGTDAGSASSSLERALDRVLRDRGPDGYAAFKGRLRLSSADKFGEHMTREPAFPLWVNPMAPVLDGKRWYHQFSVLTATAGGFDIERDVRQGHGPLGALYPTNTNRPQKEGDTATFLYLVPTGMNVPERPTWGGWPGRYGVNETHPGKPYYWANQTDTWQGTTSRDNTLARWAEAIQNDFKARASWCVTERRAANHPPEARVAGPLTRTVPSRGMIHLDASGSRDPDRHALRFAWFDYREAGTYRGPALAIRRADAARVSFQAPEVKAATTLHLIVAVTDAGEPPLTRYSRVVVTVTPRRRR